MENDVIVVRYFAQNISESMQSSFGALRTNLLYTDNLKVITVASALPNEGKTLTAFQLAQSFAELGKKVVILDCDLRKCSLQRYFVTKRKVVGISEYLTGQAKSIIYTSSIKNLDVIMAGKQPPNPTELLSSEKFVQLISLLKEKYDYVIIDTPPMTVTTDSAITGRFSDGVVFVIRNDFTKKRLLQRIKVEMERNGARIVGVVLNRMKKNQKDYNYYGYGKYY